MKYLLLMLLIGCTRAPSDIEIQNAAFDIQKETELCNELAKDLNMEYAKYVKDSGRIGNDDLVFYVCDIKESKPHKEFNHGLLFSNKEMEAIKRYRLIKSVIKK